MDNGKRDFTSNVQCEFIQFNKLSEVVYKYQHNWLRINIWKMQYNV